MELFRLYFTLTDHDLTMTPITTNGGLNKKHPIMGCNKGGYSYL